jgi:hypothetical protein
LELDDYSDYIEVKNVVDVTGFVKTKKDPFIELEKQISLTN